MKNVSVLLDFPPTLDYKSPFRMLVIFPTETLKVMTWREEMFGIRVFQKRCQNALEESNLSVGGALPLSVETLTETILPLFEPLQKPVPGLKLFKLLRKMSCHLTTAKTTSTPCGLMSLFGLSHTICRSLVHGLRSNSHRPNSYLDADSLCIRCIRPYKLPLREMFRRFQHLRQPVREFYHDQYAPSSVPTMFLHWRWCCQRMMVFSLKTSQKL